MGRDCLWKAWHKNCLNLGIHGVGLYGGTKHSSATDLRKYFSPEHIKRATMHFTNKAFERYFQVQAEDIWTIYNQSKGGSEKGVKNISLKKDKIIKITKK
jgi:hypothetical protein